MGEVVQFRDYQSEKELNRLFNETVGELEKLNAMLFNGDLARWPDVSRAARSHAPDDGDCA